MKIKTSELTGAALDWAVAKCEGRTLCHQPMGAQSGHGWWVWEETPSGLGGILLNKSVYMEVGPRICPKTRTSGDRFSPSTDWAQGGPIIEREKIDFLTEKQLHLESWCASISRYQNDQRFVGWMLHQYGPTPLIAAMRCYVASKLGNIVDVPDNMVS